MEELFLKILEYLKMDDEIPADEFFDYYSKVTDELMKNYQDYSHEHCLKSHFVVSTLAQNAATRGARKGPAVKKYRKVQEKCSFWGDAIKLRLTKEGMTNKEIDEALAALGEGL